MLVFLAITALTEHFFEDLQTNQDPGDIGYIVPYAGGSVPQEEALDCLGAKGQEGSKPEGEKSPVKLKDREMGLFVESLAHKKTPYTEKKEMDYEVRAGHLTAWVARGGTYHQGQQDHGPYYGRQEVQEKRLATGTHHSIE